MGAQQLNNSGFQDIFTEMSPFGMGIKTRNFVEFRDFRYKFNGKESDSETGTQDYGARIYDPRLSRFLSVDPLGGNFPFYTPYQFAGNKPIAFIDFDGLEDVYYGKSFKRFGNKMLLKILEATGIKKEAEKQFAKNNSKYDLYIVIVPNSEGGVYRDSKGELTDLGSASEVTYELKSSFSKEDYAKAYNMLKEQGLDPSKTIKAGKIPIIMEVSEEFAKTYETEGLTKKDRALGLYALKVGAFTIWHGFQHAIKQVEGINKDPYGRDDHRQMYGKDYAADSYDWYASSPSYNDIDDKNSPAGKAKGKIENSVEKIDKIANTSHEQQH